MKSIEEYSIYFGDNLMSWITSKQKLIVRSSVEIEYRAPTLGSIEMIWL